MEVGLNIYPAPTDQLIIQEEFISPSSTSCCRVSFAADVIDKQRGGEGKVRRDSISARLKNLLSSRSLDKSLRISKPSSRFGESSELELFDIREIENWSFVRNTTRPARIDADQRPPPGCAPIRSMHSPSHLNRHQTTKRLLSYNISVV